ncbi:MAG: hypothetical protein HRT74_04120 [Flavobacteriales bacterium]|nr:hypothetical protein [Flavobacteriales bacterium]
MPLRNILIGIPLLLLLSCSKDESVVECESGTPSNVFAGVYDDSFIFTEPSTPLELNITYDQQNLYGEGEDSLDIDMDGIFDLKLTLQIINEDSLHLVETMPNPFPNLKVTDLNNIAIAKYPEFFPIGMGQSGTAWYASMLEYEEQINILTEWDDSIKLWGENPANIPYGNWYTASEENYLAIKISDKYGWIRIDGSSLQNPRIVSYAAQL